MIYIKKRKGVSFLILEYTGVSIHSRPRRSSRFRSLLLVSLLTVSPPALAAPRATMVVHKPHREGSDERSFDNALAANYWKEES